ncbi:dihydrodipicolinate reductase, partial [Streptomyces sp. NPDC005904]
MIPTVVWGTGNVGRAAVRAVEAHPALTLAGVLVHSAAKVGRDAGELAGLGQEVGVAATD